MRDELWENTRIEDKTFPINIFHVKRTDYQTLHLHWHEHFEIIRFRKGKTVFHINGQRIPVKAGDLLFMNSGELHGATSLKPNLVEYDAIVFHPSLLGSMSGGTKLSDRVTPYVAGTKTFANLVTKEHPHYDKLFLIISTIIEEFDNKQSDYEHAVRANCQLAFTWLIRWCTIPQSDERKLEDIKHKTERFKPLLSFVEDHYDKKITIEQAAELVHLSPYHFCNVFKKLTGLTFGQFLNLHRVYEAEHLLRTTSYSITEIAEKTGYGSINHFSKMFKKLKGFPPSQLRKNLQ